MKLLKKCTEFLEKTIEAINDCLLNLEIIKKMNQIKQTEAGVRLH